MKWLRLFAAFEGLDIFFIGVWPVMEGRTMPEIPPPETALRDRKLMCRAFSPVDMAGLLPRPSWAVMLSRLRRLLDAASRRVLRH
jgi:hypothetical protein